MQNGAPVKMLSTEQIVVTALPYVSQLTLRYKMLAEDYITIIDTGTYLKGWIIRYLRIGYWRKLGLELDDQRTNNEANEARAS